MLGQQAENQFVGMNCGILDQYSSALGQAGSTLLLDCRDLSSRVIPIAAGLSVVICDTRAERNLVGTEYGDRRAQCEAGVRILQASYPGVQALRDVSPEMLEAHAGELPPVVAQALPLHHRRKPARPEPGRGAAGRRPPAAGRLFRQSYLGARDLYEIGAPSMEAMLQAMSSGPGIVGGAPGGRRFWRLYGGPG